MSQTTLAVLEQIRALSAEERQELMAALPSIEPTATTQENGLNKIYEALEWRYEGDSDEAARVGELQR